MLLEFLAVCENSASSWENRFPERWRMSRIINSCPLLELAALNGAGQQIGRRRRRNASSRAPKCRDLLVQTPRMP